MEVTLTFTAMDVWGELQPGGFVYHLGDALGSIRQIANGSGVVTLAKNYEPYGNVLGSVGSGSTTMGYTGEILDASGLQFNRARYYSSATGTFTSKDMWQDYNSPQTLNGWNYTAGNPVNRVDPSGQCYRPDGSWDWWTPPLFGSGPCPVSTPTSTPTSTPSGSSTPTQTPTRTSTPTQTSTPGPRNLFPSTVTLLAGYTEDQILKVHELQPNGSACFPTSATMALNLLDPSFRVKLADADSGIRYDALRARGIGVPTQIQQGTLNRFIGSKSFGGEVVAQYHSSSDTREGYTYLKGNVDKGIITIVSVSWGTDETLEAINLSSSSGVANTYLNSGVGHAMVLVGYDTSTDTLYFLDPAIDVTLEKPGSLRGAGVREYSYGEFMKIWMDQPNRFIAKGSAVTVTLK